MSLSAQDWQHNHSCAVHGDNDGISYLGADVSDILRPDATLIIQYFSKCRYQMRNTNYHTASPLIGLSIGPAEPFSSNDVVMCGIRRVATGTTGVQLSEDMCLRRLSFSGKATRGMPSFDTSRFGRYLRFGQKSIQHGLRQSGPWRSRRSRHDSAIAVPCTGSVRAISELPCQETQIWPGARVSQVPVEDVRA